MSDASYQTLPRDLYEVAAPDVARDIINAAANSSSDETGSFDETLEDMAEEYLTRTQIERLQDMGHEVGEWSFEYYWDGSFDADPCPGCGEEDIFNIIVEESHQMVSSSTSTLEDQEGAMHPDDTMASHVTFIRCGACSAVLFDEG
jgi:hypothetical protein